MEKISRLDISGLQRRFNLDGSKKDFFFVEKDNYNTLPSKPYRTETYGIGLYRKGKIILRTGLISHLVEGPSIITMGPGVIRSWGKTDQNPYSSLIFFTEAFFLKDRGNSRVLKGFDFFENNDCHVLPLNDALLDTAESIISKIRQITGKEHPHQSAIVRSYIDILIHEIDAAHKGRNASGSKKDKSTNYLTDRFKAILANEFIRHRSVSHYASELHVTSKYLSTVVKEHTGKTAGEWIDEMVILEAKVLLQSKELSIAQIAEILHFNDQSAFGKFFKVNTSESPMDYRKALV